MGVADAVAVDAALLLVVVVGTARLVVVVESPTAAATPCLRHCLVIASLHLTQPRFQSLSSNQKFSVEK